jgi:hypothetical protein|tara:strand:+ start:63 stop:260 length:198 start_codon:yes stop_codon:yes gene_type:complete
MDPDILPKDVKEELDTHKHIHIDFWPSFRLFFKNFFTERFPNCTCKCLGVVAGKTSHLQKIYYDG